ncbi:SDR family oxidoreductase [Silvimonas amylolytica]|uniref:SDR family oxidoreductase n=1 Tax=Silvimonas amylolytica TaxID=449663 RepID=UPI001667B9DE
MRLFNGISPGAIRTPINKDAWSTPEALARLLALIPCGRIGEVEDIGKAAFWLASDDCDDVVGTSLVVNGGVLLYPEFADNGQRRRLRRLGAVCRIGFALQVAKANRFQLCRQHTQHVCRGGALQ